MTDEKDLQISRLEGEVAALSRSRGGVVTGTLKVLATLAVAMIGLGLAGVMLVNSHTEPSAAEVAARNRAEAERIIQECERDYGQFADSLVESCRIEKTAAVVAKR